MMTSEEFLEEQMAKMDAYIDARIEVYFAREFSRSQPENAINRLNELRKEILDAPRG